MLSVCVVLCAAVRVEAQFLFAQATILCSPAADGLVLVINISIFSISSRRRGSSSGSSFLGSTSSDEHAPESQLPDYPTPDSTVATWNWWPWPGTRS